MVVYKGTPMNKMIHPITYDHSIEGVTYHTGGVTFQTYINMVDIHTIIPLDNNRDLAGDYQIRFKSYEDVDPATHQTFTYVKVQVFDTSGTEISDGSVFGTGAGEIPIIYLRMYGFPK